MNMSRTLTLSVVLLALLTWLMLSGTNADTNRMRFAVNELDRFAATESALHRDVLLARAGMLRNYDSLVQEIDTLYTTLDRLGALGPRENAYRLELSELEVMVRRQETLTEDFKSRNAIFRNSLSNFNIFTSRFQEKEGESERAHVISGVATALLRLTIDTSPDALDEFDRRLAKMRAVKLAAPESADMQAAVAHALMLRNLLPATNGYLRDIFAVPTEAQVAELRTLLDGYIDVSENKAEVYRFLLYSISLALVVLIAFLALRLQGRAAAAQHAAQVEHVIATISTRLIDVRPDTIDHEIERALEELGRTIGADRAYFILANGERCYQWRRLSVRNSPSWPARAISLARQLHSHDHAEIMVRSRDARILQKKGAPGDLESWFCIPSCTDRCVDGLLAFDSIDGDFRVAPAEFGLFRMARDALTHAVERDALAQVVQRLEQAMQQARRMETIGAFASGIAHNFNNIIGAILGYTEIAASYLESGREPTETLAEIRRAGERARDLVSQILTFGRGVGGEANDIPLVPLLEETVSLLGAASPCDFTIVVKTEKSHIIVSGLAEQLQQVVLNVCNNAAQAMDNVGRVLIEIDRQTIDVPRQLSHGPCCAGNYAVITVIDSGRGMDEVTLKQIFDPFFTTRAEGNGLGLASVLEIVRGHAGALHVQSAPGEGTRFEIWLPCREGARYLVGRPMHSPVPRAGGETILLFDPDRARLQRNEEIVAALGFEPVGYALADTAYNACREDPTRFQALLLCHQPGSDVAFDLACALKRLPTARPIVFAMPSSSEYAARVLATAGITEIVHAPLNSAEVSAALSRSLDHMRSSRTMAPAIVS
nr:two-component system VirA-like sensor kinase [uncultured Dongia sp.]